MKNLTTEDQIISIIELPAINGVRNMLPDYDTEALEEAYRYLYDKKMKESLQRMIWRELRARKTIMLDKPQPKDPWKKRFSDEWDKTIRMIRNARKTQHDYVAVLTKKEGQDVKAVRMNGYKSKEDLGPTLVEVYPEWNVKGTWRLTEEDFM